MEVEAKVATVLDSRRLVLNAGGFRASGLGAP